LSQHQKYPQKKIEWWEKHKSIFHIVGFLAHQILGILGSQIKTKNIFLKTNIITNLRGCHSQMVNLKKLIFMSKNWPNDSRICCKSPFNLVYLIELGFRRRVRII
jgi:hypothetical protein